MAMNKQQFGRAFRINNSFLPFEQWEHKHRYEGEGFTRPRGKKYAAAIKRHKDGFSKLSFAATNATNAMVKFGKSIHNLGDRVRDEINNFPDIPGEICSVELTRQIRKVNNVNNFKFNARPENFSSVIEADPTIIYLRKLLSDLYCYNTAPSVTIVEGQQLAVNEPAGAAELRVKIDERMATILDSNFDNMTTDDVLLRLQQSSKDLQELYPQEPLNWDDKLTDNFNEIFGSDYDEDSQQS
ncbi:hypothetical protein NVP1049O_01 [Vibrio phage 1.049.O._10N.286.54.B5]|nr:hypothetical protein NVP1049O_01 [Vibrio phage 1.049.O._10N.286.54.B5]